MITFTDTAYPLNYTVRNLTTGDGEQERFWDEPEQYLPSFPEPIQTDARVLASWVARHLISRDVAEEALLHWLLPHIEHRALYDSHYVAWETALLHF